MYRDSSRSIVETNPPRFRDMRSQCFVQFSRINGSIFMSAYRDSDGEGVYISMTDYEVNRMIEHLQKLLDEK
jgi:hypothetical protein